VNDDRRTLTDGLGEERENRVDERVTTDEVFIPCRCMTDIFISKRLLVLSQRRLAYLRCLTSEETTDTLDTLGLDERKPLFDRDVVLASRVPVRRARPVNVRYFWCRPTKTVDIVDRDT
jgi:hypothetical protein